MYLLYLYLLISGGYQVYVLVPDKVLFVFDLLCRAIVWRGFDSGFRLCRSMLCFDIVPTAPLLSTRNNKDCKVVACSAWYSRAVQIFTLFSFMFNRSESSTVTTGRRQSTETRPILRRISLDFKGNLWLQFEKFLNVGRSDYVVNTQLSFFNIR
jgi:hypothetical protein